MSQIFHKSCYTSRSTGYKYRTLSTNTGEKKHRDTSEDNTFEKKLKEFKRDLGSRIAIEVDRMADARESILEKFNKIDTKINLMIELQDRITELRTDLRQAEYSLAEFLGKVEKIEIAIANRDTYSWNSRKTSLRSQAPIFEEKKLFESTHVPM